MKLDDSVFDNFPILDRSIKGEDRVKAIKERLDALAPVPPAWLKAAGGDEQKADEMMKRVAYAPSSNLSHEEALAVDKLLLSMMHNMKPVAYIRCNSSDSEVMWWRLPKHDGKKHTVAVWDVYFGQYHTAAVQGLDHVLESLEVAEAAASLISMSRLGSKEADETIKTAKERYRPWATWAKEAADKAEEKEGDNR